MEVLLRDEDLLTVILEFLHSRKLFDSALALEKETGILIEADDLMPEHSKYLRNLCLNGEWDNVMFYLEPFTELDELSTGRLTYLVLKQKYIEILHSMTKNKCCLPEDKEALMKIMMKIRPHCSREELQQMRSLTTYNIQESSSIVGSRFQCFREILEILGPFFGHGLKTPEDNGERDKTPTNFTRLESVIADSLFLDECCRRCRERAFQMKEESGHSSLPSLSTTALVSRGTDPASNAAVLFWILSLKQTDIYRQPYHVEDVKINIEKITKPWKLNRWQHFNDPSNISPQASSASIPKSAHLKLMRPLTARSQQIAHSFHARPDSTQQQVSASGPTRYADHNLNRSNTNNSNNNNAFGSKDDVPVLQLTSEMSPEKFDEELGSENSSAIKVNGWTNANLEQGDGTPNSAAREHHDARTDFIIDDNAMLQEPDNDILQPLTTNQFHRGPLDASENVEIKVDASHEQFLHEQKVMKREKEEFLRNLEEKERENAEIRKHLMQMHTDSTKSPNLKTAERSSPEPCSVRTSYSPRSPRHFSKLECIPLDYVEDTHAIRTMSFHPSGQVYAVGSNSKTLRICSVPREIVSSFSRDLRDPQEISSIKKNSPKCASVITKKQNLHKGSVYCTAWNDEGSLLATGSNDKLVKLLGFDILGKCLDENPRELLMHRGIVREVSFMHESNNTLASAGVDQMVHISDCRQEKTIHSLAGHSSQILGLYSWHHAMLSSSSEDKTTRLWDIRTPRCISIIGAGGSDPSVPTSVCVDTPGYYLAMGLDCSKVALYDLRGGKMTVQYKCHNDEVRSIRFNPVYENLLLSSSYDGSIVLTDVQGLLSEVDPNSSHLHHWKRITESNNKLIQCRWHPNGDAFATTSVDKTCKLYLNVFI